MKKNFRNVIICITLFICLFATVPFNAFAYTGTNYDDISQQLEQDVEKYHIPGMAVIVVSPHKILFAETYGDCDSLDTPFIIGSMSKSFTALSVMQLAEKGKIDLDAPITDYLDSAPYLKDPSEGERITVKQLLNQTSGLGTYQRFGNAKITDSYGKYQYANVNYGILGKLIESVSGESYSDYVNENIFAPLSMSHTAATLEKSKENSLIDGYRNYFGIPIAGKPDYPNAGSWSTVPAGYISSSISDMGKYLQMYLNGGMGIISQSSLGTIFYDNVPQDESGQFFYGMGWMLSKELSEPVLLHSGLVENYTSNMFILPESEIGIAVLVNMNDYFVDNNLLGNIVLPLLGVEKQEQSGNSYVMYHLLLNLMYLLIFIIAIYPLVSVRRWKNKNKTKGLLVLDILRHGLLPAVLLIFPNLLGVPLWAVWYFVKDLFFVLTASSAILLGVGIYKMGFKLKREKKIKR